MSKFLVLKVRENDEIADICMLSMANLHSRLLRDHIMVDDESLDDKCLSIIQDAGIRRGPRLRFVSGND